MLLLLPLGLWAQDKDSADASFAELARTLEAAMSSYRNADAVKDKKAMGHAAGNAGGAYLDIARLPAEEIVPNVLIAADKKSNLKKAIEYADKSIAASEEAGDLEQLKVSYRNLGAAQKLSGNVKGAMATYARLVSLKKGVFGGKKANAIEKKQLEYDHGRREDSIRRQQQLAEEQLREQRTILTQKQLELQATHQTLNAAERDKDAAREALQQSQSDLSSQKSTLEENEKRLTLAEAESALQSAKVQLQANELALKQNELQIKDRTLEQQRYERYLYIGGIGALLAIALLALRSTRLQKRSNLALQKEKKRSEELLLNILPVEVAEELMEKGFADAKHFDNVTVLFTDFISFTSVAETMSPQQLVGELHVCFKAFDDILGKYRIEKIKTVGDAYLAVSGLPNTNTSHAEDVVAAAIEIRDFMARRKAEIGIATFGVRIGINSGNVVAGIVGVRKFSYDIWGDTVNIAARMEQNSEDGRINLSETTYQLVKDKYACIYRGKIEAKNKGSIDMYYLV